MIEDKELIRRAISKCSKGRMLVTESCGQYCRRTLWVIVMELFSVGSTVAKRLCTEHGFDPDQIVKREDES